MKPEAEDFTGYVYRISNTVNNKVYIGVTTSDPIKRIRQHFSIKRSGCPVLKRALRKYGVKSFVWDILYYAKSPVELTEKEIYYISHFKSNKSRYGYNILPGGYTNEAASKARMVKIYDVDTGEVFGSIKEACVTYGVSKEQVGLQLSGRQERVHGLRFKYLDSQKQFRIEKKKRSKKINSRFRKPLYCVELKKEFKTQNELAKAIGFSRVTVQKYLYGKKTTIPYTIRYAKEEDAHDNK